VAQDGYRHKSGTCSSFGESREGRWESDLSWHRVYARYQLGQTSLPSASHLRTGPGQGTGQHAHLGPPAVQSGQHGGWPRSNLTSPELRLRSDVPRWTRVVAPAVVGLVVLGGALYSVHLGSTLRFVDERDYYAIAQNLVHGRGYSLDGVNPTAFRPPGYPLFMSLFVALGADVVVLRILNFFMLATSMLLLRRLALTQGNRIGAAIAPMLCAGYVVLFYTAGTLYPQTLAGLLLLATTAVLAEDRLGWLPAGLILGMLFGWLALSVIHFLFSFAVVVVWVLVARTEWKPGTRVASVAVATAVVSLMVGVWLARNERALGAPVLTTNGGITLLHGNSEKAGYNSGASTDISAYAPEDTGLAELQLDRYYQRRAIEFMRRNEGRAIRLYALKVLNWFNYRNDLAQKSESSRGKDMLMFVSYVPLLLLFAARLVLAGRFRVSRLEALLVALYLSNSFAYAIWHTRIRYRLPYDLLLIAVVALFIDNLLERRQPRSKSVRLPQA